ncbi:putative Mn2+ efflux pump MntP [Methanolinea mesophila]|uniref:manganese efflux pump MntP n=1 Tax=Methanolinea mesophila TaxID=547055 RepID=UPI001AE9B242|nr:manganese efflux pump MntP family protein [Methanolinea mesophila]MBP1928887.1 putative Mn2+ efflux pump MntP [Methanolinea mesophila]
MDILTIVIIGIGLAMDCFAVALARGAKPGIDKVRLALMFALIFGLFQAGMTILGWAAGSLFIGIIAPYDHWIAFIILSVIGVKMVYEGLKEEHATESDAASFPGITSVLLLAVATSIDALAIGLGFAFLDIQIAIPSLIIGLISAIFAIAGVMMGTRLEKILGNKMEILGGIILIGIGIKIVLEHLM